MGWTGAQAQVPGVDVTSTQLFTNEAGGVDTFEVVVTAPPAIGETVTININSDDASEGSVTPTSLVFTNADWDMPQTVTVTGVDDAVADGNVNYYVVNNNTISGDPNYDGLAVYQCDGS